MNLEGLLPMANATHIFKIRETIYLEYKWGRGPGAEAVYVVICRLVSNKLFAVVKLLHEVIRILQTISGRKKPWLGIKWAWLAEAKCMLAVAFPEAVKLTFLFH